MDWLLPVSRLGLTVVVMSLALATSAAAAAVGGDGGDHGESRGAAGEQPGTPGWAARVGGRKDSAVTEQQYYLKRLFLHYGARSRLSVDGLQRLLRSLGLGEVQVVEIEHEELGHHHVTHLDILEVQEDKHTHTHSSHNHNHSHGHGHSHSHPLTPPPVRPPASKAPRRPSPTPGHRSHRDRRDVGFLPHRGVKPRQHHTHRSGHGHPHGNCLNVSQLLINYGLNEAPGITPKQFTYMCPALLYQIDSRLCIHHLDQVDIQSGSTRPPSSVWAWGLVAITVISLSSLLALGIIPFLGRAFCRSLLTVLVAMAVGTLCGDALLHLLPHAQAAGSHSHGGGERRRLASVLAGKDAVWKGLAALGGIYLLFITEYLLGALRTHTPSPLTDRSCQGPSEGEGEGKRKELNKLPTGDSGRELEQLTASPESLREVRRDSEAPGAGDGAPKRPLSPTFQSLSPARNSQDSLSGKTWSGGGHSHGHCHQDKLPRGGVRSIAWMVIVGDGIHNFTDGLAIGAAFSAGIGGGLSTSIAVLCHELPHEIGDSAVLIRAGVSMRQVVMFNLASALLSYLGLAVGIGIAQFASTVTPWVFTAVAGMFLYVALVDVLPEMMHGLSGQGCGHLLPHFLCQTLGLLLGAAIMLCVALFEDQILINIPL